MVKILADSTCDLSPGDINQNGYHADADYYNRGMSGYIATESI